MNRNLIPAICVSARPGQARPRIRRRWRRSSPILLDLRRRPPRLSHPSVGSLRVQLIRDSQRTHGNQAVMCMAEEADGQAFQKKSCGADGGGGNSSMAGECAECRNKRLGLQRRSTNHAEPTSFTPVVHDVLHSRGQTLDPAARAFMESRLGHDFSQVRVHTDARAVESARVVNALAYML